MGADCEECQRLRIARDAATVAFVRLRGRFLMAQQDGHRQRARALKLEFQGVGQTLTDLQQEIRRHNAQAHSNKAKPVSA